ncbi:hypothetical protein ERO13_A13G041000v2 [Gossypium hirsutum]|nr:hypothetical protein ERO13_A13G041000v2 [Gossypium hirsutum]
MESLSCLVLKPSPPTRLFFPPRIPQMALPGSTFGFPPSMDYQLPITTAKLALKPIRASTSTVPTTPSTTSTVASSPTAASTKKALVPIGFGTEEMEAVILVDVLRRAGAEVTVASVEPQLEVHASGGTKLVADTRISTCSDRVFDLVALPGGMPGSAQLRDCEILKKITSKQAEEKRLYGGISTAPAVTLLPWGLLKRKRTTCHPAFFDRLPTFWAVKSNIQVSGELTTSQGPGTSFLFALALVEQLFGESVAREIGELLFMHSADDKPRKEEFNKVDWAVLVPVANGSEEIEIVTIVDILRRAKVDVVVASVEKSVKILASQGVKIIADKLIGDAAGSIYDLIILPQGGVAGTGQLQKSRILKKLLKEQDAAGRMLGAVCSSLTVLHKHGLLKEKKATAHPSAITELSNPVDGPKVVIDGKLITSMGLATVSDFALAIVSKFFGHARARSVAEGLVFEYPRS